MNRHDTIQAAMRRDLLARHPGMHADAIASHYLALAATAATLKELVNAHRYAAKPDASLEALMERATQQIRSAHLRDFGLALEWEAVS